MYKVAVLTKGDIRGSLAGGELAEGEEGEEGEKCSICMEGLNDASACLELGEPIQTTCGHALHASCFARLMETSEREPVCPMCRTGRITARFPGTGQRLSDGK